MILKHIKKILNGLRSTVGVVQVDVWVYSGEVDVQEGAVTGIQVGKCSFAAAR